MNNYRNEIKDLKQIYIGNEIEIEYVEKDDVMEVLDDIEGQVQEVNDCLSAITGLTEIDEIKSLINELLKKLY